MMFAWFTRWRARFAGPIAVIVVLGLVLRILVVVTTLNYGPVGDPADYDRTALSLAGHGTFPPTDLGAPGTATAYRPPAYPLLLAATYRVSGTGATSGRRFVAGRMMGAVLGAASIALAFLLIERLYTRRRALWGAGVVAFAPPLIWLNGSLLAESLFIPLVLALACCVVAYRERPRPLAAMAAGGLLGLAVLTRGNGLLLIVPVAIGLATGIGPYRARAPLIALGCMMLTLAPWTVRNASVFHRLLPVGTQSGLTMAGQWNDAATEGGAFETFWLLPQQLPATRGLFRRPGVDEGQLDATLRSRAAGFAKHHPAAVIDALLTNAAHTLDVGPHHTLTSDISYGEMGVPRGMVLPLRLSAYVLLLLAVVGGALAAATRSAKPGRLWLWMMPVFITAGTVLWSGGPRYLTPVLPFLAIPCAMALERLGTIVAGGPSGTRRPVQAA